MNNPTVSEILLRHLYPNEKDKLNAKFFFTTKKVAPFNSGLDGKEYPQIEVGFPFESHEKNQKEGILNTFFEDTIEQEFVWFLMMIAGDLAALINDDAPKVFEKLREIQKREYDKSSSVDKI